MPDDEVHAKEASRIAALERKIKIPDDMISIFEGWDDDRHFVRTVCNRADTEDTVVTNHILRAVQAGVTASNLPDPVPRFKPGGYLPAQDNPDPTIQQQSLDDGNPANRYPAGWSTYTKTQEILIGKQMEQSGFLDALHDLNFEARFACPVWLKVRWIEDDSSDALGRPLPTEQSKLRRYTALYEAFEDDEFPEDSEQYDELVRLSDDLKEVTSKELMDSMSINPPEQPTDILGLEDPEEQDPRVAQLEELSSDALFKPDDLMLAPSYQGYSFEIIDPPDIRFDWTIRRPSELRRTPWIAHRSWMLPADIEETWGAGWDDDDKIEVFGKSLGRLGESATSSTGRDVGSNEVPDRPETDVEAPTRGKLRAVWEYWDLVSLRRYRWVQGGKRLLDSIPIRDVPTRKHCFFPLFTNQVPGALLGLSDCELGRPAQEWINLIQTHERQAKRAQYPRWLTERGLLDEEGMRAAQNPVPYQMFETDRKVEDLKKGIYEFPTGVWNPALYNTAPALAALETSMGLAASRMGAASAGAKHATTEAIANQGFGDRVEANRAEQLRLCKEVFEYMAQMNALRMSADNVTALVGPGSHWPVDQMEHDQILSNFMVRVAASPSSEAEKQKLVKALLDLAQLMSTLQLPISRVWFVMKIAEAWGVADEVEQMIDLAALLSPPEPSSTPPDRPASRPEDQGDRGGEGGRPPMQEQAPPITPETIPNNPSAEG